MKKLHDPQQQIYEFILRYMQESGGSPTVREICQGVGLASPSTVLVHLNNMETAGLIRRDHAKRRSISIIPRGEPDTSGRGAERAPLIGRVAAGTPILAAENVEGVFAVPELLTHGPHHGGVFLLRVEGDSMVDAGIRDGDYIVVDQELGYVSGDIVVVRTAEETATVKRIYPEGEMVRLQPENELYEPIYLKASEVEVVGRVTGLMRRL